MLKFKDIVACCYGQQQSMARQERVPSPQVWAMAQIVFLYIGAHGQCPCVNNQNQVDWLLSNHYNKRCPYTPRDFTRC
jgi:hypothetical protein